MPSLADLLSALKGLDHDAPEHALEGKSFQMTNNAQLGFNKDGSASNFHIGLPFQHWPEDTTAQALKDKKFESNLAVAFRDTLQLGIDRIKSLRAGNKPIVSNSKEVLIDITSLHSTSWHEFFLYRDGNTTSVPDNSLAKELGRLIDDIPHDLTPVVRFIFGDHNAYTQDKLEAQFKSVFFPGGECVVKSHPNARLHAGFYSPSFGSYKLDTDGNRVSQPIHPDQLKSAEDDLKKSEFHSLTELVRFMVTQLRDSIPTQYLGDAEQKAIKDVLDKYTDAKILSDIYNTVVPTIGWNHAKILAVHGQTLLSGGANYWGDYADNKTTISDLQCKIIGGAAGSAHAYCDYLWEYLNELSKDKHESDFASFRFSVPLAPKSAWPTTVGVDKAPIWHGQTDLWTDGKYKALAVSKLGDWIGPAKELRYPIQFVDAVRDVILNVLWCKIGSVAHSKNLGIIAQSMAYRYLASKVSDAVILKKAKEAGIAPTAWATRISRVKAIEWAEKTVYLDIETLTCGYHNTDDFKKTTLVSLNKQAQLEGDYAWDGILWPYDLLIALGDFLRKFEGRKLYILLTPYTDPTKKNIPYADWADSVPAAAFKDRLRVICADKAFTDQAWDTWFNAHVEFRRIAPDTTLINHTKAYCIDEKLLYIGSDNAYPNYNEEFGVWIEDATAVSAWVKNMWTPRFEARSVVREYGTGVKK